MTQLQVSNYVFDLQNVLGKGSTGTVYLAYDIRSGAQVAIKIIQLKNITNQVTKYLLQNQVKALQLTNHPNVLRAYEVVKDSSCYYVITNYCPNRTLEDYIREKGKIPEEEAVRIFKQIVQGYASLQTLNIMHRDLKPSNILFSESNQPVICDFGYCEIAGYLPKPTLQYNVGSPAYMAPQSITGYLYSQASQVWSLGTIYYQMLQGKSFIQGTTQVMQAIMQIKRKGPYLPDQASQFSKNIIVSCMKLRPTQRITIRKLLNLLNNYLNNYRTPPPHRHNEQTQFIQNSNQYCTTQISYTGRTSETVKSYERQNRSRTKSNHSNISHSQHQQAIYHQQFQQQRPSSEYPMIQLGQSLRQDKFPSSPSQQSFRPVSNRLGLNIPCKMIQSIEIQEKVGKINQSGIYRPEQFPQYYNGNYQNQYYNYQTNKIVPFVSQQNYYAPIPSMSFSKKSPSPQNNMTRSYTKPMRITFPVKGQFPFEYGPMQQLQQIKPSTMLGCLSKNRKMIVPILKNSNMQNRQLQPQLTNYDYVGYSQNPNYYFVPIIYTNQRM